MMDQRSQSTIRSSGIPRLSRLPVPQETETVSPQKIPTKFSLPSRSKQILPSSHPQSFIAAAGHDDATISAELNGKQAISEYALHSEPQGHAPLKAATKARTLPRRPRASLSDRTIETLSQIPPSPSPQRRKSGFSSSESPSKPCSRPGSSLSKSRPNTSHGQYPPLPSGFPTPRPVSPTKRHLAPTTDNPIVHGTPSRRSVSSSVPKSLPHATSRFGGKEDSTPSKSKKPIAGKIYENSGQVDLAVKASRLNIPRGSKTLAARPTKPRPSVQDAFAKPLPKIVNAKHTHMAREPRSGSPDLLVNGLQPHAIDSPRSNKPQKAATSVNPSSPTTENSNIPSSSAILRETIAKAKAARRNASKSQNKSTTSVGQSIDLFPDIDIGGSNEDILRKRVATARTDGRLNIAALGLKEIPAEVTNMYNANLGDVAWYESVDLTRLVAADNEIEVLDDKLFPDDVISSRDGEDDYQGSLFGGLETLDLHGNNLKAVPFGLRRLEHLTTLNVSKNHLGNDTLQALGQLTHLRDLRMAENALKGSLGSEIISLKNLEILEVNGNSITGLSNDIHELTNLRVLNVSGNRIDSLPFESLATLPLIELHADRNRLSGSVFPINLGTLRTLKILNVANNALTTIAVGQVALPSLQSLDITENRFTALPNISGWTQLITLIAGGNKLTSIPEGMTSLQQLKTVDLTRNDIRKLDESLGLLDSLTVLRVANNPLRERRFLNMDTGELKRELKARLLPDPSVATTETEPLKNVDAVNSDERVTVSCTWPVKSGGIIDRSSTQLERVESSDLESIVQTTDIKSMIFKQNVLATIPQAINLAGCSLTTLDLSHNKLSGTLYCPDSILLPLLRTLDLSSNAITGLDPLLRSIEAPRLAELNVSRNRLTSLTSLRTTFPSLTTLFASDNSIRTLEVDVVRGLQVVDVSGNEINHLDAKLGLLGAEGLRTLMVGGNTFRVPRREVVDKGTEAVLSWLKSKIPDGETLM